MAHGERGVAARGGRRGGKTDCFSILLAIEGFAPVSEQIIVSREGFVPRVSRIDLDNTKFLMVPRSAM
jgi:hypothetical protein